MTTNELGKAIVERREQERERMRRPVRAVPREKPKPAAVVTKAPPPPEPAARFGTWAQVYGDYQKRDAAGPGILNCCANILRRHPGDGINVQPKLALNIESRASTVGFVAGADFTSRGLYSASDGFIAGVTAGYTWSEMKLNTVATDVTPADQPAGRYGRESPARHCFGARRWVPTRLISVQDFRVMLPSSSIFSPSMRRSMTCSPPRTGQR